MCDIIEYPHCKITNFVEALNCPMRSPKIQWNTNRPTFEPSQLQISLQQWIDIYMDVENHSV